MNGPLRLGLDFRQEGGLLAAESLACKCGQGAQAVAVGVNGYEMDISSLTFCSCF